MQQVVEWIAADWGTSNLRVWIVDQQGSVIAAHSSAKGMAALTRDEFEPALLELIEPYLSPERCTPVLACGMVGAKQGWCEAPYTAAPCQPGSLTGAANPDLTDKRITVKILPGVKQNSPADVMRGEETQIAGFLRDMPEYHGSLCLPGTHSKWVEVANGRIVSFATFMSGEMFALLGSHSVLRHAVEDGTWDRRAFVEAVGDSFTAPGATTRALFSIRASSLLHGVSPTHARSRLSGLLLGVELHGAEHYWRDQNVHLIGDPSLCENYQVALREVGKEAGIVSGEALVLSGLRSAFKELTA
ncbi:2-dehydro-3-deoxygalactonokinase [Polycladidibacter hongkongensis]|uniref:2-dehydro-3-deoxygalactonokinase n=1 Tax=Polycladidibacter hongkongensis TaxID=1647556 RepID=UPI00083645B1|nr:2-dehydro-3-deoxygalactonokinase [Pseudovibrio hongkongensis]